MDNPKFKVGDVLSDPIHDGHVFYVVKLTDEEYLTIASNSFWVQEKHFNNLCPFKHYSFDGDQNVNKIDELDREFVEILYL